MSKGFLEWHIRKYPPNDLILRRKVLGLHDWPTLIDDLLPLFHGVEEWPEALMQKLLKKIQNKMPLIHKRQEHQRLMSKQRHDQAARERRAQVTNNARFNTEDGEMVQTYDTESNGPNPNPNPPAHPEPQPQTRLNIPLEQ
ncbi:uncharacterized protein PV06_03102 [Exophiala oligosperma]|uniref:Uncharacterized protein n=1 Tax=Exophiala oligosperma TaxID=215243 RepID=A0A0D2C4E0_9EURO|nr:uncharacterized protein PV06_03102 [Exophiala oligosperma]KIW44647.1 hypothetical protein PV06_03102 [Exophiala oligosperma]